MKSHQPQPDDAVSVGQAVVSIEAMKMEQDLCAPRERVVEILAVGAGDQVAQGDELLRLAPDPNA
ncbi:MAG: biotin/lipoyl-containing protein [Granulosicoccus sp.]